MFVPTAGMRVYVAPGATDIRKAINGLSLVVAEQLELDPFFGYLFAFYNRRQDLVKILYWDRNGFCLWQKRLEKDQGYELGWLLDGLNLEQQKAWLK